MAIVTGNKTNSNAIPNGTTQTISHQHNAGTGGLLLICVAMTGTNISYTGATYNGVAMTEVQQLQDGSNTQVYAIYALENPTVGTHDVVITMSTGLFNPMSFYAVSFTGAGGIGNSGMNAAQSTTHTQSLTVSDDSLVFSAGVSPNVISDISVDGTSITLDYTHNNNRQVSGGVSAIPLTAGSVDVAVTSVFGNIANLRAEILIAGSGGDTGAVEGSFLPFF